MTTSTDAVICYGVLLGEEISWIDDCYDDEGWWLDRNGYKPPFELYTDEKGSGGYVGGKRPPQERISAYYGAKQAWLKANPIPFELINVCCSDYPEWIIAVPGSETRVSRGYPEEISVDTVDLVKLAEALDRFKAFLLEIEIEGELKWYLGSYWG